MFLMYRLMSGYVDFVDILSTLKDMGILQLVLDLFSDCALYAGYPS